MNDLSLYVYMKKWIIVVIVNKLILIYSHDVYINLLIMIQRSFKEKLCVFNAT